MSLPRYPKYKDSGVEWLGEVPEHWRVRRLKHVCEAFPSNVDKKSHEGEQPVLLCNYTDVYYDDRITADMQFMSASASPDQIEKFTLRAGDTVITKDSETADDIAVSAYVPADLPGVVCGYHLSIVRPRAATSGNFVKRLFDSAYTKATVAVKANGLTRVGLSQYDIDNIEWPWPPPEEQVAIASFLDGETSKIDALISEQQRLAELLKEKRQAVISHAVTKGLNPKTAMKPSGIDWLGEVPAHWTVSKMRRAIARIEQGWSPECFAWPAEPDEWGVLKTGCVNRGVFDDQDNKALPPTMDPVTQYEVQQGDVLMSRASGSLDLVGSTAFVSDTRPKLMLSDKVYRLHAAPGIDSRFLVAFANSRPMRFQIEQAISGAEGLAKNLPQSTLLGFSIAVPPVAEQKAIVRFVESATAGIDALIADASKATGLLRERRGALVSAAVTGQIDIRKHNTAVAQ